MLGTRRLLYPGFPLNNILLAGTATPESKVKRRAPTELRQPVFFPMLSLWTSPGFALVQSESGQGYDRLLSCFLNALKKDRTASLITKTIAPEQESKSPLVRP